MGKHMIVSSPLRSPAVIVGAPVAAVLATMGSNVMLGGVLPSAEEVPLRAESVADVPDGALPGPPSWSSSWSPSVTDEIADDISDDAARARPADEQGRIEDAATAPVRVARVADRSTARPTVASRSDDVRVADDGPERPAQRADDAPRERVGAGDESDDDRGPAAVVSAGSEPTARTDSASERLERVPTASSYREDATEEDEDGGAVVDLDTPAGGLSVLSFS